MPEGEELMDLETITKQINVKVDPIYYVINSIETNRDFLIALIALILWDDEKRFILYPKYDPIFVPLYCTIQMLLFS